MKPTFSFLFLFGILPILAAPLAPSEYEKLQQAAPEVLEIEVLKVEREPGEDGREEIIRMTVAALQVKKTASEVKPGDFLFLVYSIRQDFEGRPLPGQVPLLQVGQKVPAFLAQEEGTTHFRPAAGLMSFRRF